MSELCETRTFVWGGEVSTRRALSSRLGEVGVIDEVDGVNLEAGK